jgi:hypothetical protein
LPGKKNGNHQVSTSIGGAAHKRLPFTPKRTEVVIHLCATSSASVRGSDFAGIPAIGNPVIKPHSFPDIEAETAIAKPPNAHKRGLAHPWFAYFALLDNPVKSIPNTYLAQSFNIGSC